MLLWENLDLKEIDIARCSNDLKLFTDFEAIQFVIHFYRYRL